MQQRELLSNYVKNYRPDFNKELFVRKDEDLINDIRNIIYSCERDSFFTIKVLDFSIIDNYDEINRILYEYENSIINKSKANIEEKPGKKQTKRKKENKFSYINLKDSDLILIKITYFIQITEKKDGLVNDTLTVYIAIPKIVDDFYYRINGNLYSAMYQIVDASTYNNTQKKSKKQNVTLKTEFMPMRVYKYTSTIKDVTGEQIPITYFTCNMFSKTILLLKYIIAEYGFQGTIVFLGLRGIKLSSNYSENDLIDNYVFKVKDRELYIISNKYIYDHVQIAQSLIYTALMVSAYNKTATAENMLDRNIWVKSLGAEFVVKNIDTIQNKGNNILNSLEFIYDKTTQEDLKLPDRDKNSVYAILRWLMYHFNDLRKKDNLDISTKKISCTKYIAALYGAKIAKGLYIVSDKDDKAKLDTIKKALKIPPMYLIKCISTNSLINYKNTVNDLDAIMAIKYTYKGVSGIGEKSNAISSAYRGLHPSHLGRVDVDSSSNSDPGISGTICPLCVLHDGHFDEYQEPCSWEDDIHEIIDVYNKLTSKIEMCRVITDLGISDKREDMYIMQDALAVARNICLYARDILNE